MRGTVAVRRGRRILAVALVAVLVSSGLAAAPAAAVPTLTVNPDKDLVNGQSINVVATEVVGTGIVVTPLGGALAYPPAVYQCDSGVSAVPTLPTMSPTDFVATMDGFCAPLTGPLTAAELATGVSVTVEQPLITGDTFPNFPSGPVNTIDCRVVDCVILVMAMSGTVNSSIVCDPCTLEYFQTAQVDFVPAVVPGQVTATPEGDVGSTVWNLPVTLSPPQAATVTVDYQTVDDTATAGADYVATSGTLTFAPGETLQEILIEVLGDTEAEADEIVDVIFSNPSPGIGIGGQGRVTIVDDEPTIAVGTVTANPEGDLGSTVWDLPVTLTRAAIAPVTVDFATADGTATSGADYVAASGTVTFAPGETLQHIPIEVLGDDVDEADETGTVELSSPSSNAKLGASTGTFDIIDDDLPLSVGAPFFYSAEEGDTGSMIEPVPLTLSRGLAETFTVDFQTVADAPIPPNFPIPIPPGADTLCDILPCATPGVDYIAASGTATFPAGTTEQTVPIEIVGDTVFEADEWVLVELSNPSRADARADSFSVIITNDEVSITPGSLVVDPEGNTGFTTWQLPVTLSGPAEQPVTVDYTTIDGTATAGADYTAASGTVIFAAGETEQSVPIDVLGDTDAEGDETLVVRLSNPSPNAGLTVTDGQVTIVDDEPSIRPFGVLVRPEGDSGSTTWQLPVFLSRPSAEPVTVDYHTIDGLTMPGLATSGADFASTSGTVTFAAGETVQHIDIEVFGDLDGEAPLLYGEWGLVQFSNPSPNAVLDTFFFGVGLFIIIDDDDPPPCPTPFSGTWNYEIDGSENGVLDLQFNSSTITGQWADSPIFPIPGPYPVTGAVSCEDVTFTIDLTTVGFGTIDHDGTLAPSGRLMSGSWDHSLGAQGTFVAALP